MKKTFQLILVTFIAGAGLVQAKVITVDNNAGSVAMFSSLQAAVDSAATNDTIFIAGSPNSYGSVSIGRRLNFVWPGYFLSEHSVPGINSHPARIDANLYRRDLSNASGCTFSGLSVNLYSQDAGITGITVTKCVLSGFGYSDRVVVSINRCWTTNISLSPGSSIRNSIIGGGFSLLDSATATNCVIRDFNSTGSISTTAGSSISNCIFITSTAVSLSKSAFAAQCKGSISHCMAVSGPGPSGGPSYLPDGLGNNPTIHLFYDVFTGGVQDKAYQLIDDSPAKGSGFNGVDMGVFAGPQPYVIGCLPQIPRITRFVIPAKATSTSGLRIEMDAQAF